MAGLEREIRYCTASDGVRIAYAVSGHGEQWLVHTTNMLSATLQFDRIAGRSEWIAKLGERFKVIEYDSRATGLSQREVADISFEALVQDLGAVIDAAEVDRCVLFGYLRGVYTGVWYASQRPERVSHLVLWPSPIWNDKTAVAESGLVRLPFTDWESFTELWAHQSLGWAKGDQAHELAVAMRESVTQQTWLRFTALELERTQDEYYEPAARVKAPTLVLNREGYPHFAYFAGGIQGAKTRVIGQGSTPYTSGAIEGIVDAIAELSGLERKPSKTRTAESGQDHSSAVILFTDIVSSTALTEQMGDVAFRNASRTLDEALRSLIRDAGGSAIDGKLLGDGVMAVFLSAREAIEAALRCQALCESSDLQLHLGIHAGDVIREQQNVYGGAVNIAARICALGAPGEVLVSDVVRGMARSSAGVEFEDRGEQEMKGVGDPVRVYAVRSQA